MYVIILLLNWKGDFMHFEYEIVKHVKGLPVKAFFVSIGSREYHWHSDLEIIWILKGSIVLQLSNRDLKLRKDDCYIINTNEVHCLKHTDEANVLLALQINPTIASQYFVQLTSLQFNIQYIPNGDQLGKVIRKYLAGIMTGIIDESPQQLMAASGYVNFLLSKLLDKLPYELLDDKVHKMKLNDLERLKRIIRHINHHYMDKIMLQEIADSEFLNKYYLSHFIKDKLGIGFQDFINRIRLEKAIEKLIDTKENILEISENCGFSDVKYLNKLMKEDYNCTAREYRNRFKGKREKAYSIKNNDTGHRNFDEEAAIKELKLALIDLK